MHSTTGTAAPRQGFDVKQQVAQRPWLMLAAAVAAGYVVGSSGGGELHRPRSSLTTNDFANRAATTWEQRPEPRRQHIDRPPQPGGHDLLAPVRGEIDELTSTAVAAIKTMVRDLVRDYTPEAQQARRADRGLPNPAAGQDYVKTYHPAAESRGM